MNDSHLAFSLKNIASMLRGDIMKSRTLSERTTIAFKLLDKYATIVECRAQPQQVMAGLELNLPESVLREVQADWLSQRKRIRARKAM